MTVFMRINTVQLYMGYTNKQILGCTNIVMCVCVGVFV